MIVSEKGKNGARFQSHIHHFVNFIQVFNSFNLCEITRHSDWSPGLIPRTGPKKVENISTLYYPASKVAGSIGTKNFY
jgi:hypothetical protein